MGRSLAVVLIGFVACAAPEEPEALEPPLGLPGCTSCLPGDFLGGTFYPGGGTVLLATRSGTLVRLVEGKRLELVDDTSLAPVARLPFEPEDGSVTGIAVYDSLATLALVLRSSADEATGIIDAQVTLESFDATGALRWSREIARGGALGMYRFAAGGELGLVGGVHRAGRLLIAFALDDGEERWRVEGDFDRIAAGSDRVAVAQVLDGPRTFVRVFDHAGTLVWQRMFENGTFAYGMRIDAEGRLALLATQTGGLDLGDGPLGSSKAWFAARFERDGALDWAHAIGASEGLEYQSIGSAGDIVAVAGSFSGVFDVAGPPVASMGTDAVVLLVDAAGPRWRAVTTGSERQQASGVIVQADRILTNVSCSEANDLPIATELGTTVVDGAGVAFVGYAR